MNTPNDDFFHKTDVPGLRILKHLHDGWLDGFVVKDKSIYLYFRSLKNINVSITIPDVVALKADDFRLGNIIFEISIYEKGYCPRELLANAFGFSNQEAMQYLDKKLNSLGDCAWSLLALTSSYGCELYLITKSVAASWKVTV